MAKPRRVFKPLNKGRVQDNAKRSNSKYDSIFVNGVTVLKMKQGVNNLRIARGTDATYWGETIWVHSYIGSKQSTYLCPKMMNKGKKCPVCDAANDATNAGDKEEAKQLLARERTIAYVIDRDAEKDGLKIWDMSWSQQHEIDAVSDTKRGVLDISNPDDGFDLSIMRQGSGLNTRYTGLQIDRESSPLSDNARQQDAWVDQIDAKPLLSLLKFYDVKFLADILTGKVEEKDEDDDEADADAKPAKRGRAASDDADEYEGDDDINEPAPERVARANRRAQEEADDDEPEARPARGARGRGRAAEADEEEADEAPRGRRGRAAPADTDDDDERPRRDRRGRASADGDDEDDDPAWEDEPAKPARRGRKAEDDDEQPPARSRSARKLADADTDEEDAEAEADADDAAEAAEAGRWRRSQRAGGSGSTRDAKPATRQRRASQEEDDDEPAERPARRGRAAPADVDEEDDDADARPARGRRAAAASDDDDDEPVQRERMPSRRGRGGDDDRARGRR